MRGFRYKHGDKPLEGYTIQRAAGRGGFGEVYYAVSDSGREVALKVIQGYEQIELRGVSQCMNLKSPHLVTIFDVRRNEEDVPFVIMEFVSGPSLRQLLDECPSGLGTQKAAFFLREIAKGLSFLHECGIVHRDLKPGNIFYENGYVKIGDYGLSKAIAPDHHSGQTITVGTVHYMAPEIGMGTYDRGIDIYALGAMLYEMLTGQVPYLGGSPGEILMKHMTAEPDVSAVEEPFRTVIRKSMARDPEHRYHTVQEMVEAVFGAEHIQQSVSCFSPESLSMVAERVAQRVAVGGGSATPPPVPPARGGGVASAEDPIGAWADRFGDRMVAVGDRLSAAGDRIADRLNRKSQRLRERLGVAHAGADVQPAHQPMPAAAGSPDPVRDPLSRGHRKMLALCVLGIMAVAVGVFGDHRNTVTLVLAAVTATAGAASGIRLAQRRVLPVMAHESVGFQRLSQAGLAILFMFLLSLPVLLASREVQYVRPTGTAMAVLIVLLLTDWTSCAKPGRRERVSFQHAVVAGLLGFLAAMICNGSGELAVTILAGASLMVQVAAPWDPFSPRASRSNRPAAPAATPAIVPPPLPPTSADGGAPAAAAAPMATPVMTVAVPAAPPVPVYPVPQWLRYLWLALIPLSVSIGITLLVLAGHMPSSFRVEFAMTCGFGVGLLLMGILCLIKACQSTYVGWWSYFAKPLLLWACAQTILISAIAVGNCNLRNDEQALAVFFIIFPIVLMPIVAFVRVGRSRVATAPVAAIRPAHQTTQSDVVQQVADQSASAASLPVLAASGLLGFFGWMLLLAAIVIGVTLAIDVPGMVAAGLPDPSLARQLNKDFGDARWPQLFRTIMTLTCGIGLFAATVVLMASRRWSGVMHMFRAVIGAAICALSLTILNRALHCQWAAIAGGDGQANMAGSVLNFLDHANGPGTFFAAICMVVALAVLFWPASRPRIQLPPQA